VAAGGYSLTFCRGSPVQHGRAWRFLAFFRLAP
jgi:hypothetical protein